MRGTELLLQHSKGLRNQELCPGIPKNPQFQGEDWVRRTSVKAEKALETGARLSHRSLATWSEEKGVRNGTEVAGEPSPGVYRG